MFLAVELPDHSGMIGQSNCHEEMPDHSGMIWQCGCPIIPE
jgi:hypothetical protein